MKYTHISMSTKKFMYQIRFWDYVIRQKLEYDNSPQRKTTLSVTTVMVIQNSF